LHGSKAEQVFFQTEITMTRKFIDCREHPSASGCTVALSADSEDELVDAAAQHAVAVHGETDTPELRRSIRESMHEGTPPVIAPSPKQTGTAAH
jgi:predicted small metal-binding protein